MAIEQWILTQNFITQLMMITFYVMLRARLN